jgi:hypothetical protein
VNPANQFVQIDLRAGPVLESQPQQDRRLPAAFSQAVNIGLRPDAVFVQDETILMTGAAASALFEENAVDCQHGART